MTGERGTAHDAFTAGIVHSLHPVDALENHLAHSIAESYSNKRRPQRVHRSRRRPRRGQSLHRTSRTVQSADDFRNAPASRGTRRVENFAKSRPSAQSRKPNAGRNSKSRRSHRSQSRVGLQPVPPLAAQTSESAAAIPVNGFDFSGAEFAAFQRETPREANAILS